jgi:hypothetical protein
MCPMLPVFPRAYKYEKMNLPSSWRRHIKTCDNLHSIAADSVLLQPCFSCLMVIVPCPCKQNAEGNVLESSDDIVYNILGAWDSPLDS